MTGERDRHLALVALVAYDVGIARTRERELFHALSVRRRDLVPSIATCAALAWARAAAALASV